MPRIVRRREFCTKLVVVRYWNLVWSRWYGQICYYAQQWPFISAIHTCTHIAPIPWVSTALFFLC